MWRLARIFGEEAYSDLRFVISLPTIFIFVFVLISLIVVVALVLALLSSRTMRAPALSVVVSMLM